MGKRGKKNDSKDHFGGEPQIQKALCLNGKEQFNHQPR